MSDSGDQDAPPAGDAFPEERLADLLGKRSRARGKGRSAGLKSPLYITWWERLPGWLEETLAAKTSGVDTPSLNSVLPVVDRLISIITGLMAMILVDRTYGTSGLGYFAWFFSLSSVAGYIARYGIPHAVENRIARLPQEMDAVVASAMMALLAIGLAAVCVCTLTAFWGGGPAWRSADNLAVLLLGPTILFQNINTLRLALLNGTGRHHMAVGLNIRQRIVFLAAIFVFCKVRLPVPLLIGSFALSHLVVLGMGRKAVNLPSVAAITGARHRLPAMMDSGRRYLFADNLLDVIFYLDLLILGWFVGAEELGIYARALILARLCLIVPTGLRPVVRRLANRWKTNAQLERIRRFMARTTRLLFFMHGLLAMFLLVCFPRVVMTLFGLRQWSDHSLTVLSLVLPGLVFYSAVTALEPVFEAWDQSDRLRRATLIIAVINLILNLNLIPFAGIEGAAVATSAAMFIHFLLLNRFLPADLSGTGIVWLPAAGALYLAYVLIAHIDIGLMLSILLGPLLLGVLLWLVGFFNASTVGMSAPRASDLAPLGQRPV